LETKEGKEKIHFGDVTPGWLNNHPK
jgi:hypothetical protein